jgi:hypothetical protein
MKAAGGSNRRLVRRDDEAGRRRREGCTPARSCVRVVDELARALPALQRRPRQIAHWSRSTSPVTHGRVADHRTSARRVVDSTAALGNRRGRPEDRDHDVPRGCFEPEAEAPTDGLSLRCRFGRQAAFAVRRTAPATGRDLMALTSDAAGRPRGSGTATP